MLPYLHLGGFQLGTFGLLLWLGCVLAAVVLHRNFLRNGLQADAVVIVSTAMIAGVAGAKLWHILQDIPLLRREWSYILAPGHAAPTVVIARFFSWFSAGFAWFGGLAAGVLALMLQGRGSPGSSGPGGTPLSAPIGPVRMLDLCAPAAAIGYGIGRIGCLTSGDGDYGIPTSHWWGVHIHDDALAPPSPNPPSLLVEPTPIYELLIGLCLGWYLWVRGRKDLPAGQLTGEYLLLSGVARFLIEFIRINPHVYGFLTNAQAASLLTIVAGGTVIAFARGRRPSTSSELSAQEV